MPTESSMGLAADSLKRAQKEMVQWETNKATLQAQIESLVRQKELTQKQIDEKVTNANAFMAEERKKIESDRNFLASEKEKLEAAKKDLAGQIQVLRDERAASEKEKNESLQALAKAKTLRGNVDQFVVAVQRAYSLIS